MIRVAAYLLIMLAFDSLRDFLERVLHLIRELPYAARPTSEPDSTRPQRLPNPADKELVEAAGIDTCAASIESL